MILDGGEILFSSQEEGMRPLMRAIKNLGIPRLRGCIVADRVVGKAAALLTCFFGAKEVHCGVVSARAVKVFEKQGVAYHAERTIPEIMDRSGKNVCPFERSVLDIEDPQAGFKRLYARLLEMGLAV